MTTKTTHTPGPWELTIDDNGHGDIVAGSLKVCSVGYVGLFPVAQADARLIASSPALLAALKEALANLSGVDDGDGYTDCNGDRNHELIERIQRAIARAEQEG